MTNIWLFTFSLLIISTASAAYVLFKVYKRKNPNKRWNLLGFKVGFWQEAGLIGIGLTVLILIILKSAEIISF